MTTATAPRVSVCIPARNHAPYIGAAITSALTQDAGALEVVVVDDGSQDRTGELVAAIRDPRVRLVRHATPQGVAVARNACLRAAR